MWHLAVAACLQALGFSSSWQEYLTALIQNPGSPVLGCLPYQRKVKTVPIRYPRSMHTLSVVVGTVSVLMEPQKESQTLCPSLKRSYHLSSMGNKQGWAVHHTATNHDKFQVKTKARNTVLISQQQQLSSLLGPDFPRSMASLWSSDPLGCVILFLPLRRPILLCEDDVMPLFTKQHRMPSIC